MNNKKEIIDPVQAFEQMEAHSINIAELVASYYKKLKDMGIPENLSHDLTREFHVMIWRLAGGMK